MNTFTIEAGRRRRATTTVDEQPGAHTGTTRKYIPGYSDSNIIFRAPTTGNDANDGLTRLTPKQTKAACDTAAGSTKKIRIVEACTLNESVSKPTEMERGVSGTISSSTSAPVDAWTQAGTPSFSTTLIEAVVWSPRLKIFVAVGQSGKVATSPDGDTWTQQSAIFSAAQALDIFWCDASKVFYCVGNNGAFAYSSDGSTWTEQVISEIEVSGVSFNINCVLANSDASLIVVASNDGTIASSRDGGGTWQKANTTLSGDSFLGGCWSERLGKFYLSTFSGNVYSSSDGSNWSAATTPSFSGDPIYWITDSEQAGRLVAVGGSFSTPKMAYSTDGDSFTQSATPAMSGVRANYVEYCVELQKYVAAGNGGQLAYSSDGNTWTLAATPSFGVTAITDIAYSPLLGKLSAVGGSGKIAYSTAFANTISANVAGFTIQAVQYSGTITAYNCTMKQPGTTAALSTENCRITEPGAHISNNAQTHFGLLIEGETYFTTTPASQNAFALNCCTVVGRAHIYNASSTYFEQIRDCIFEDGITANFSIAVESGNIRGTCTNVVYGQGIGVSDPKFVDTTDYQLQREVNEYDENSPCVEKASYYFNSNGDRRDMGAWSYTETAEYYIYERAFEFRKPSAKDATTHVERGQSSMYWGEDMTPDVANDPDAQGEELILQYRTLPIDHIECIKYLRQQRDLTVRIDYDPEFEQAGTVTVNGDQSAGAVFLLVDSTTARPGQKVTIGTKVYTIIRMSGTTKLVLDRDTEDAVTDNQVLNLSDTAGKGEFQYNPEQPMNLTRFYENNQEYLKGARMHFARKKP